MPATPALNTILQRNLQAIARQSPAAAREIAAAEPAAGVGFEPAGDGSWTVRLDDRLLASRHEPLREARMLADQAPVESAACIVVLGMGAGHHVAALADRIRRTGALVVFEPDVPLLRSVFSEHDHTAWINRTNLVIITTDEVSMITAATGGMEGLLAAGVKILEHPPSRARLAGSSSRFTESLTRVMRAVKTNVVTSFVQVETTLRNFVMNVDRYATAPGIADLAGAARGHPGIVVSAGPSLERNIDLLAKPGVRDRFVIVAAQTVLKKLLSRGIRPHFVTALDHHEISRRFYEGLTAADVEGVTLIVEPKANPAILSAYPGTVRCPGERILDDLLGPELSRTMGTLTPGATVAHLAYYVARHLGCDPVLLVGQDLGFTDGQYYHAGAAIHQVWAGELNEFNTLEMLEWQRIVRSRHILHRASDHLGRPIYTDEQMATYLVQFERDFAADEARGLTTIDATEGGVAKRHTRVAGLAQAIEEHWPASTLALPSAGPSIDSPRRRTSLRERVASVRRDTQKVADLSRRTAERLGEMVDSNGDQRGINTLIGQVHALRDQVVGLQPAYGLVSFLNQTGGFKRFQADRAIELDQALSPIDRQRRQIERDRTNVTWIADAADQLGRMLDDTLLMLDGGPRITRDASVELPAHGAGSPTGAGSARPRCLAVIPCFASPGALLAEPVRGSATALELTLRRLVLCSQLDGVVLVPDPGGTARGIVEGLPRDLRERLGITWSDADDGAEAWWSTAFRVRRWSERCWRGGPGNLTIWDELWRPASLARILGLHAADAAVVLGPQWCCVDPGLTDALIARYRENPEQHPLTFSPAAPGLAPCVISRELLTQLAESEPTARMFATIGGVLGYSPALPRHDPLAKPPCVEASPAIRDLGRRAIADTAEAHRAIRQVFADLDPTSASTDAAAICARLTRTATGTRHIVWHLDPQTEIERVDLSGPGGAEGERGLDAPGLTIRANEQAICSGRLDEARAAARRAGLPVHHLRVGLACEPRLVDPQRLLGPGDDVTLISVDLLASNPETFCSLTGVDGLAAAEHNTRALLRLARSLPGSPAMPRLWVIPRITRRDEVYLELERFYDRWLMEAGACTIDPLPAAIPGARISPLPRPVWVEAIEQESTARLGGRGNNRP